MKQIHSLFVFLILSASTSLAQGLICVQGDSTSKFTNSLDTALAISQSGDFIYLPGGVITYNGTTIIINKKLTIIGCGYNQDSSLATGITIITKPITFAPTSTGSLLTGVFYNAPGNIYIQASNITIIRNSIDDITINVDSLNNILISENIFSGRVVSSRPLTVVTLSKNVVFSSFGSFKNGTFINNIFLLKSSGGGNLLFSPNVSNCTFKNNIFLHSTSNFGSPNNNYFENNLFVGDSTSFSSVYNISINNIFSEPIANIFINGLGTNWTPSQNYHLKPGCRGVNTGNDGTDVGIYGSTFPFKDGGFPFNPHYQSIDIPSNTDANGDLLIKIKVKAQDR